MKQNEEKVFSIEFTQNKTVALFLVPYLPFVIPREEFQQNFANKFCMFLHVHYFLHFFTPRFQNMRKSSFPHSSTARGEFW